MAGDEDKKKKKKTKKVVDEAPPPAPEPEPAPAPPPVVEGDDNDDWLSAATAEEPTPAQGSDEAPAEGEFPAEGEVPAEGEEVPLGEEGELPPQPKKKPKFFVHWDRRKARFYDYNFDYGTNYYSSMVGYVDQKNTVFSTQGSATVPRRMAFAERGMYSSLERSRNPDIKTQSLLNDVRSSIRNFETSQRVYAYGSNRKKY